MAATEATIIDPHGDLILQVENERLLVSSRVLSLVSPVFEAMFKPNFKEGTAFQMGKGEPLTIPLHEDDMEALTFFCKAIHHTINGFSEKPNPLCLEKLAVICDKYQCTGPMEVYGTFWLQMQPRQIEELSSEDIGRLLLFAYIVDLPRDFSTLAAELLDREKWFFDKLPGVADHPLIRHDLPGALNIAKLKMTLTLQRAVMKPIAELVTSSCGNAQSGVIEYQRYLKKFRISPYEGEFHRQSFRTIAASALRLPAIYVNPCTKPSCSCPQKSGTNLRTKLEQEIKFWKASEVHFCLDCFNGLKPSNCRVCLYGSLL